MGGAQPLTKVKKNAMNEIMERVQFSHIPQLLNWTTNDVGNGLNTSAP